MKSVFAVLLLSSFLICRVQADDQSPSTAPVDAAQPNAQSNNQLNALSAVAGSLIDGVEKVQKDAKKKGSDIVKRTEALLDEQEAQQKRFGKILDTWERQQAQYQKYLDSLDKK